MPVIALRWLLGVNTGRGPARALPNSDSTASAFACCSAARSRGDGEYTRPSTIEAAFAIRAGSIAQCCVQNMLN